MYECVCFEFEFVWFLMRTLNLFTVNAGNTSRETLPAADDDFWESGRGGGGGVQQVGKLLTNFF